MNKKLYVGNLTHNVTEDDLKANFSQCGNIVSLNIIRDKFSGQSKGFGFVEMSSPEEAEKAKEELSGTVFEGRTLRIDEARPPRPKREFRRF